LLDVGPPVAFVAQMGEHLSMVHPMPRLANVSLLSILALAALPEVARAEVTPEVELAAGGGVAIRGGDYDQTFSSHYALGVRGIVHLASDDRGWRLGAELALDRMHFDWVEPSYWTVGADPDLVRLRALVGARFELQVAPPVWLFGRALAGLDPMPVSLQASSTRSAPSWGSCSS